MRVRLALAAVCAVGAAGVIALLADGDDANGGPAAETAVGSWSRLAPSPLSRTEVGAARIGDSIYAVGGFEAPSGETTAKVARYRIAENAWELAPPMPIAVNHAAVAALRGALYVHGGYTADAGLSEETDALQRFDRATGAWSALAPSGMPRGAHVLVPARGRLYAIGGARDDGDPLRLVQVYDPETDRWRRGPKMKVAREHLAAVRIGSEIFVLGGRVRGENLDVVERLDTRRGKWSRLPPLRTARSGFGAASATGRLIAVGGEELAEGNETIGSVERYDPKEKRRRRLPAMITPRHGLGVVSLGRLVFAIEGGPSPGLAFSSALEVLKVPKR